MSISVAWLALTHKTEMHEEPVFVIAWCCQPHRLRHWHLKMNMGIERDITSLHCNTFWTTLLHASLTFLSAGIFRKRIWSLHGHQKTIFCQHRGNGWLRPFCLWYREDSILARCEWLRCSTWVQCATISQDQFSFKNSRKTPHISPVRASYGVSFVSARSDRGYTIVIVVQA